MTDTFSSSSAEANATLQQQLGEANTALHAKEADCNKLAKERDRLVTQLGERRSFSRRPRRRRRTRR